MLQSNASMIIEIVCLVSYLFHNIAAAAIVSDGESLSSTSSSSSSSSSSFSALEQARQLPVPVTDLRLGGEWEHLDFWKTQENLLRQAWEEWDSTRSIPKDAVLIMREDPASLFNPILAERIQSMWNDPTLEKEQAIKALFQEVAPGVFVLPEFFSAKGLMILREFHLDPARKESGIPTRRPNGMNRNGVVLDDNVEGGVSYPTLDAFREYMIDQYIRPLARAIFPEYTYQPVTNEEGYNDDVSYAFTVHYSHSVLGFAKEGNDTHQNKNAKREDRYLPQHTDASLFTFNINLNFANEDDPEHPAELLFSDPTTTDQNQDHDYLLTMKPGMAVLHRGMHKHQALPLIHSTTTNTSTEQRRRDQLIIWLFGRDHGDYYVRILPYETVEQMTVKQRWSAIPPETKIIKSSSRGTDATTVNDCPADWLLS